MTTVGLVAEYNPFHNGHYLHILSSKAETKSDYAVVVMSGNFVQRGEPAICDKYARCEMALRNGADIVLELPVHYATASAEYFARCAVSILHKSHSVDYLSFGSETGSLHNISEIAGLLMQNEDLIKKVLRDSLNNGVNFPKARALSLESLKNFNATIPELPNDILALEYVKALKHLNSHIIPHTIKRTGNDYHSREITSSIASATAIRLAVIEKKNKLIEKAMPSSAFNIFEKQTYNILDNFSMIFQYIIKTRSICDIEKIFDVSEGLENRITEASSKHFLLSDIVKETKTKRYTFTRVQRTLLHILLNITKENIVAFEENGGPQYIRILGFRREAQPLLKSIIENSELPIVMNLKNANLNDLAFSMLEKEIEADDLYYIAKGEITAKKTEYKKPLVILNP